MRLLAVEMSYVLASEPTGKLKRARGERSRVLESVFFGLSSGKDEGGGIVGLMAKP